MSVPSRTPTNYPRLIVFTFTKLRIQVPTLPLPNAPLPYTPSCTSQTSSGISVNNHRPKAGSFTANVKFR